MNALAAAMLYAIGMMAFSNLAQRSAKTEERRALVVLIALVWPVSLIALVIYAIVVLARGFMRET